MPLTLSEEVTVALNKNVETGSCAGVVIKTEGDTVQIALRERGILVKPGSMVHIKSNDDAALAGWGSVEGLELAGDVKLLTLGFVRYEGESRVRAARCPIELAMSAKYDDRDDLTQKIVGQTVNLSITGIRARFHTPAPQGVSLHMVLHLGEEKTVEAIAHVVRVVPGTETFDGGYEVGLEFQRFIRGYEHLIATAPSGREYPPERAAA